MREANLDQLMRDLEQEQRKLVPETKWENIMQEPKTHIETVHDVLKVADKPLMSTELAAITGLTVKQVSGALTKLSQRVKLKRTGKANTTKYELAAELPPNVTEIDMPSNNSDNVVQSPPVAESRQCDPLLHHLDVIKASVSAIEFYAADLHAPPIETIPHEEQDRIIGALREVQAILNPSMAASLEAAIIHLQDYFGGSVNAAV